MDHGQYSIFITNKQPERLHKYDFRGEGEIGYKCIKRSLGHAVRARS